MAISRKQFVRALTASAVGAAVSPFARAIAAVSRQGQPPEDDDLVRVRLAIQEYDRQGYHRTAARGDVTCAQWLVTDVRRWGVRATLEQFELSRVNPVTSALQFRNRRIEGLLAFDGTFTGPEGVDGKLGVPGDDTPFAFLRSTDAVLPELRRSDRYVGLIVVTESPEGGKPGIYPSNADRFANPSGPAVLQVSGEHAEFLATQAKEKADARLVADATRETVQALNVFARIAGRDPSLPPLVVFTPRSAWWTSTGERAGGLVCWAGAIRELRGVRTSRDCLFVATTGHEIGYLGLRAFLAAREGLASRAHAWVHLGANIGASRSETLLQASTDDLDRLATDAVVGEGAAVAERTPRGERAVGEAGLIHDAGGRYVSLLATGNPFFHSVNDRWPHAVSADEVLRYARATVRLVKQLAS